MGRVQLLSACHCLGRSAIKIRMMMLGQQPVSGTNLHDGAVAVEAERGVMIGFSSFQFLNLTYEISVASSIAASNCILR